MQPSPPYRPSLSRRPQAANVSASPDRCPFLGSAADPGTSLAFSSDANQCFRTRLPVPISTIHQENFCLSSKFESCPVFRAHEARSNGGALLPLTAVGLSQAESAASPWSAPAGHVVPEPPAAAAVAMSPATVPPPANSSMLFPDWQEPAHPDFQADIDSATARRQSRGVNLRPVLIGLLLLALIPFVWWLWTTVRPGANNGIESVEGTVVTLPTSAATSGAGGSATGGGGIALTPPQATPTIANAAMAGGGAAATAEATATDLENIAATATALFVDATAVVECSAPAWWVPYVVEEGDTIAALAAARGISPEEMIVANCLPGPELVQGSRLLLPPVGLIAIQPETATSMPTPTALRSTRVPGLPTRPPFLFPTPTLPSIIIISTAFSPSPTIEPTTGPSEPPATRPPVRPTTVPTSAAPLTATPPDPFPSATAPNINPSSTPPQFGGTGTPTPTGTAGAATSTPPTP